jgi:rare lipoprotein A
MSIMRVYGLLARVGVVGLVVSGCAQTESLPVTRESSEAIISPQRGTQGNPASYEVFGTRYHVLQSSDGYRDSGVASWYGNDFHGKKTSSGEPYDMFALTAAHKTLPIPTWVEVTNRRNGKTIIVKVNDRGPFVNDRIIDLSYAAALELDIVRTGTAPVFVRALGAPASFGEPKTADTTTQSGGASGGSAAVRAGIARAEGGDYTYRRSAVRRAPAAAVQPSPALFVQVGAYSDVANAERMLQRLRDSGYANAFLVPREKPSSGLHRVRIGPIGSSATFDSIAGELRQIGIRDARLVAAP